MTPAKDIVRIAAVGDLHCSKKDGGRFQTLFSKISEEADVVLFCGDLTDYGLPEEAEILAKEIRASMKIPVVAVLGNHDVQSEKQADVIRILTEASVNLLDGDTVEIQGIGFAGVKGFAGGFEDRALQPWGEPVIKQFVHTALEEALKLENALAKLHSSQKIVLMHYAPVKSTVEGEPLEIFPFLGSSRLEEPLSRYAATAVFHGHAHHGQFEGRTRNNTPVYNVAMPVLQRTFPDRLPFFRIDLPRPAPVPAS